MDKILEVKKEKSKKVDKESKDGREQFRVVISAEANAEVEVALKKVSDRFDAGGITKSDVANFVFLNLKKFFSDSDIIALRALHFNEKRGLSSLLKNEGDLPEELKKAIRAHYGVSTTEKKKASRAALEAPTKTTVEPPKPSPFSA